MKSETDVVVLGSGAAGLCAAVTAAHFGARVVLLEKADVLGGTTAWSGGWIFAPRNPVAVRAGITEPEEAPRQYLKAVLGNHYEPERVEAFLKAAPEMVGFLEENTAVAWEGGLCGPSVGRPDLGACRYLCCFPHHRR